jgi:hypothetical protein
MSEEIDTHPPMATQKLLGNLTHPCNHGIINAILRQAEREGLDRPADSHGCIASGLGGFSTFFDVMSRNACAMMHHPIHDVQKDWIS